MTTEAKTPEWMNEVQTKYRSAVAVGFLLHLNIFDYAVPGVPLVTYLMKILADRQVVAIYNRSQGIRFSMPSMHDEFIRLTKFEPDPLQPELPKQPSAALPLLERLLRVPQVDGKSQTAVIIEYPETLVPAGDIALMNAEDRNSLVTMARWGNDPEITVCGNIIFLLVGNLGDLHQSMRAASSKYEAVRIPLPNLEMRQEYIELQYESAKNSIGAAMGEGELAKATAGLSLVHIEDIFLRAKQEGDLSWELVRDRKRDIIKSEFGDVLELVEPRYGFEAVGGLENVKDFFMRNIVNPIKAGNYNRVPMGVLMTGPAGTGKTIMAEAAAKESGVNMAVLNPARIFSKWVGESERNLERALECVKTLAPCIVFIDEIDQSLRRGEEGDSGVSNRVFKRLLEFMSDTLHRGQVVFLAATNRPDLLDAALKRPGRFDSKIPFFVPDAVGRADIIKVMCRKYGLTLKSVSSAWVNITEGWTGAELEKVTIKAVALAQDKALSTVKAWTEALSLVRPGTQQIEFMTRIAVENCDDLEFIPQEYRHLLNEPNVKPEYGKIEI